MCSPLSARWQQTRLPRWNADIKPTTRKDPATRAKFEDAGLDPDTASKWQLAGTLGGAPDMSAEHRALPETHQKLKRAGLNPATASKHALGGRMSGGVPKSDIHKYKQFTKPTYDPWRERLQ